MRIIEYFDNGARYYPDNIAFIDIEEDNAELSYAEAAPVTHRIAAAIHSRGYGGGHIGLLAPNSTIAFLTLLGLFRSESVWLPINPRNPVSTNADLLERFDGELLFYHSSFAAEAVEILKICTNIRESVCIDGEAPAGKSLDEWVEGCPDTYSGGALKSLDENFALFPTGGTTGKPKGVVLTHRNIYTLYCNFYSHFHYYDDTRHLVVAPMTHTAGITGCMHFARGGTNVIMRAAAPDAIADAIEKFGITHLFLPPTVLYMMLALEDIRERDFASLQHFLVGAAPTSLEKLKQAIDVFGPVMTEAFGQSEAPASVTAKAPWDYLDNRGEAIESRLQSIGRPCVHNTVAIIDDQGSEVPRGEPGEICIRGDLVSPGYYKDPEATSEVRRFGWHHTGDVGVMDDEGFVTIVDRKKDMIITGGFNVFPNEIEQVLNSHPSVQDCAVFGVPDEKWGEAVRAVIQLKPDHAASEEELMSLVKEKLGSVKTPKAIEFLTDLPRSPVGKVLKTELRKPYWEGQKRLVS